jgi:tetratricopeptide (TPR) repeat protein
MFDQIPARVWLLVAILFAAYAPAHYIIRYVSHAPSRRDITQPPEDLSWRTSAQFARNVAVLVGLLGVGIFIFTPAAAKLAQWPRFLPALVLACGAWSLVAIARGLATKQIVPLIRGFYDSYRRDSQPKRYWASMIWNASLCCLFFWLAFELNEDVSIKAARDACYKRVGTNRSDEKFSACTNLIGLRPTESAAYLERGLIFLDRAKFDNAVADFTQAHELDPNDPWALANRGIAYAWKNDRLRATRDLKVVRATHPSNPVLFRGEALLSMAAGDMRTAVDRLTEGLKHDPNNAWSFRVRAEAYRQLGELKKSQADTERLQELTNSKIAPQDD